MDIIILVGAIVLMAFVVGSIGVAVRPDGPNSRKAEDARRRNQRRIERERRQRRD